MRVGPGHERGLWPGTELGPWFSDSENGTSTLPIVCCLHKITGLPFLVKVADVLVSPHSLESDPSRTRFPTPVLDPLEESTNAVFVGAPYLRKAWTLVRFP